MNTVQPDSFLTLHYRLAGPDGTDVVSTFDGKPATLSLGSGQLAPAIEACLVGLEEGARTTWHLEPGVAYGPRNPEMLQRVARSLLAAHGDPDEEYRVGDVVEFPTPDGQGRFAGVIREAGGDWLLFDFNHPLAGQPVTFEVQLIGVLQMRDDGAATSPREGLHTRDERRAAPSRPAVPSGDGAATSPREGLQ